MSRQQAFEAIYAKQHDVPPESLVQYRFESKDGYSLPMIASHYRTYCDTLDSIVVEFQDRLKHMAQTATKALIQTNRYSLTMFTQHSQQQELNTNDRQERIEAAG